MPFRRQISTDFGNNDMVFNRWILCVLSEADAFGMPSRCLRDAYLALIRHIKQAFWGILTAFLHENCPTPVVFPSSDYIVNHCKSAF